MLIKPVVLFLGLITYLAIIGQENLWATDRDSVIRIGVLKYGTVNWELETISRHELDKLNKITLEVVPLGSKNATHVAIQGGAVDIIVTDWVWVSRQRNLGRDYTFVPYSSASGSVVVHPDSDISSLDDLAGKQIGVAGGPVDKSWVLLAAYVQSTLKQNINRIMEPVYVAPPLLNELFIRNEFDAALNFWHYTARLEANGARPLVHISDILPALGIDKPLPMIGWVFNEQWAIENRAVIDGFLESSSQAKQILLQSNEAWENLRPLLNVQSDRLAILLRDAFRQGIPKCFRKEDLDSMRKAYTVLEKFGGARLVGKSAVLVEGTVWDGYQQPGCG